MAIPQINEEQADLLQHMCRLSGEFSQVVPELEIDGEEYPLLMEKMCDTNQLAILGLIKDVTKQNSVKLAEVYAATGRLFRVFQLTDTGRALFSDCRSREVQ